MCYGDLRKETFIFRQMSKFLGTRSTTQCKSHHQKMMLRAGGNLVQMIASCKKRINRDYSHNFEFILGEKKEKKEKEAAFLEH